MLSANSLYTEPNGTQSLLPRSPASDRLRRRAFFLVERARLECGSERYMQKFQSKFQPPAKKQPLSAANFRRLMRRHKMTIRQLANKIQMTQIRVRYFREHGFDNANAARDWVQGVTGKDPGAHDSYNELAK